MTSFPFAKMEATGNDFVVVYRHDLPSGIGPEQAPQICDREHGVGADGVLVIGWGPSLTSEDRDAGASAAMALWNADGSLAQMCGNGLRAIALLLHLDKRWSGDDLLPINTPAGVVFARLSSAIDDESARIEVALSAPAFVGEQGKKIMAGSYRLTGREVNMGNPHFVLFEDDQPTDLPDLTVWGSAAEHADNFPDRSNIEWARIEGPHAIRLRVWERGVGETQACGSGACATVVAARLSGRIEEGPCEVILAGGLLKVSWAGGKSAPVLLQGEAKLSYRTNWTDPR
jgi:diaminopimelate epimerase